MSRRSLKRHTKEREQSSRFLILCEGAVTEVEYIEAVKRTRRLSTANLQLMPPGPTSPFEIVEQAKVLKKDAARTDPFDEVWCVFDVESKVSQEARPRLDEALVMARDCSIKVALSNPCIELWLLLHKENQQAWIDSHVCQQRCSSLGVIQNKHIADPDSLYEQFLVAKRHSEALEVRHQQNGTIKPQQRNPSSGLYRLIDAICEAFPLRDVK